LVAGAEVKLAGRVVGEVAGGEVSVGILSAAIAAATDASSITLAPTAQREEFIAFSPSQKLFAILRDHLTSYQIVAGIWTNSFLEFRSRRLPLPVQAHFAVRCGMQVDGSASPRKWKIIFSAADKHSKWELLNSIKTMHVFKNSTAK